MPEFRVLTTKEQATITALLEKANAAVLAISELLALEAVPAPKKTRKPRQPKTVAASDAPVAAKKRGRPAKVAAVPAVDVGV